MRNLKTFEEFLQTRTEHNPIVFTGLFKHDLNTTKAIKVHVYGYGVFIEQTGASNYELTLLNNTYNSLTLRPLEQILWDEFYKVEMNIPEKYMPADYDELCAYVKGIEYCWPGHKAYIADLMIDCHAEMQRACEEDHPHIIKRVKEELDKMEAY